MAPSAASEASVQRRVSGSLGSGDGSIGAWVSVAFRAPNAASCADPQSRDPCDVGTPSSQIRQRRDHACKVLHEAAVVVAELCTHRRAADGSDKGGCQRCEGVPGLGTAQDAAFRDLKAGSPKPPHSSSLSPSCPHPPPLPARPRSAPSCSRTTATVCSRASTSPRGSRRPRAQLHNVRERDTRWSTRSASDGTTLRARRAPP